MKKTPGRTIAEKVKYWTAHIEAARKYPTGVTAYCRDHRLEKNNYYQWFKRLRPMHPEWENLNGTDSGTKPADDNRSTNTSSKTTRRVFTPSYRTRMVKEYDSLAAKDRGAFLRREGLYSSHISKWRGQTSQKPSLNPLASELAAVKAKLAKTEKKLDTAHKLLDLQKKIADILGVNLQEQNKTE
jgi:transposase-like protein